MNENFDKKLIEELEISEKYGDILETLAFKRTDRINLFYGGPITHKGTGLRWGRPMVLFNSLESKKVVRASYHLVYVNFDPTIDTSVVPKLIPFFGCETGIKTGDHNCDCSRRLQQLIESNVGQPFIILRRSFIGNPAFPYIISHKEATRHQEETFLSEAIAELSKAGISFYLDDSYSTMNLPCIFAEDKIFLETDQLKIIGPRVLENEVGQFFSYLVEFKTDVWENYEIISGNPLELGNTEDLIVRFDSGCDSGQLYMDDACDCSDQLRSALKEIKKDGRGLIIHIPSHDGRGYGMAGKMETEIYKAGGSGLMHENTAEMDTVAAAELLYGERYDIRTYEGAAKILLALGLKTVRLYTDNSEKFRAIKNQGMEAIRVRTYTQKDSAQKHIDAKHRTPPYDDESWEES